VGTRYDHLNREELLRLLEARDRRDATKFGLVWEANEIERDTALNHDFVALDLVPKLSCGGGPWRNLIVEGDNFDALRHLRMCFAGQVKCIYIDPPYNTGNRDFVYNDRFMDKEDSWRHSKWCEFMFQRLMIARDLLKHDGAIFVSIDDNEMPALALLMKRIFGEENYVATFLWKRRTTSDSRNLNGVSSDHEYVVCYQGGGSFRMQGRAKDLSKYTNPDNDPFGPWMSDNLTGLANAAERPNLHYDIVHPKTGLRYPPHSSRGWIYGKEHMAELIEANRILWPQKPSGRPRLKRYLTDMQSSVTGFSTVLDAPGNVEATKELSDILGPKIFSFPKPTELIAEIIEQAAGPDDLVLDFFAGSGTTAHAVHKLNAADGGRRRVILVSSTEATTDAPDKNLCRDVCATRVRRVIEGYTPPGGDPVPGLGGDFAYLRTRRIPTARLLEIDHAQVWTALQLMHGLALTPFAEGPFAWAGDEDEAVMYLPRFSRKNAPLLRRQLKQSAAVALYSWQPSAVEQHLHAGHVTHLQIPETLARRFGLGQGGKR
jgi:adenine-specific DNA-methyltransferase